MPDGMTSPEKSSIDYMRSLGQPAKLPGAEESARAAQEFPQPVGRKDMPDIRMELTKKTGENNIDGEPKPGDEAEAQKYTRRESLSDELIGGAENPQELFIGLRLMEKQREESFIPPGLDERYTPPRQLSAMYERAEMLHYSIKEMEERGWITDYVPDSGEAKIKDRRFAALAIHTTTNGKFIQQEQKYYFGKTEAGSTNSKEREVLEKAYRRAMVELAVRDIMGEHYGVRDNTEIRDSLESLTAIMHGGRMPKFKAEHLEAIFNMPGLTELETNPENRVLGDQVEEAMFLNLVMLNSGTKQGMQEFLKRPGAIYLIRKLAKEEEERRQKIEGEAFRYSEEDWKKEFIGDVNAWVTDYDNTVNSTDDDAFERTRDLEKTWRYEKEEGLRGPLTEWSNIAAWGGGPGEFGKDLEDKFIGETIGGLVGSVEAAWAASVMMRIVGAYASEGYVALPNGKSLLPLGEGRLISGDDTGKFYAYMFNMKEGKKGRSSGLKDMIGRIPDLAMNLFDWAQVSIEEPDKDGKLVKVNRSIWDAWLGTAGGKPIKDILTGKDTVNNTVEEPYHRLGDLNFKSLEREFHNTFTIMQWLMGNEKGPTGIFNEAMNVDDFGFEDFGLHKLKKIWKYIDIVMNPVVMTKGSKHLYELGTVTKDQITTLDLTSEGVGKFQTHEIKTKNIDTIKKRFFKNLMAARIRSFTFMLGILPKTIELPNPGQLGGAFNKIPAANLVELFVNEATKDSPKDEAEVIGHYIDDITRLDLVNREIGKIGQIRERAKKWMTKEVGRVTGKTS